MARKGDRYAARIGGALVLALAAVVLGSMLSRCNPVPPARSSLGAPR